MTKVITYGTYDLLHRGHVALLERAKALGDYLIVGVTADDFDKVRGKVNVQQSLMERVEAVKALGIADEIIVEEYEGQKIDDIRRYGVDIFTVGSDWVGKFDYLNEYCKVVYLPRTEGVSSSKIREKKRALRFGILGESLIPLKYIRESAFVNGIEVSGVCTKDETLSKSLRQQGVRIFSRYDLLLKNVDAVYVISNPQRHVADVRSALEAGKHVLCESPIALSVKDCRSLFALAKQKHLVLMEAIKTAYSTAYNRMILLAKDGRIGNIVSVDATCTSLAMRGEDGFCEDWQWNSSCAWGPTAFLPIFQLLGTDFLSVRQKSFFDKQRKDFDVFSKFDFEYSNAVASAKVGKGVKSEGQLVISGTKGYIFVPAPWWKTDYFEVRYENPSDNRRYFYQLDGEGIRQELVAFVRSVDAGGREVEIGSEISMAIARMLSGK